MNLESESVQSNINKSCIFTDRTYQILNNEFTLKSKHFDYM